MARGDDIEMRLIDFAVVIIDLCAQLPKTSAGCHISSQLLRSGTSPAANYGEARGAESLKDFNHKLKLVLKELNETSIWLRITAKSKLLSTESLDSACCECKELCKIITSSIKTVSQKIKGRQPIVTDHSCHPFPPDNRVM